jgi:hypothetical protein
MQFVTIALACPFGSVPFARKPFGRQTFGRQTFGRQTFGRQIFGRNNSGLVDESLSNCADKMSVGQSVFDQLTWNCLVDTQ